MITYKVVKNPEDKAEKYFTNLMKALSMKEFLKKQRKDGYLYHIYGLTSDVDKWYRLE
jgi:hypothetical protein